MSYLITKEAYNVSNTRLPDLVWSECYNSIDVYKFAAYFERNWVPVKFETFQDAFDLVQSMVGETSLLYDAATGKLYMKDSTTPKIYQSRYSIIEVRDN